MSWTDDRVALLTKLWGEGKTASEIAGELGGVTRNAVIGKAHRLKLARRVSPIQQNKKKVKKPVAAKPKVQAVKKAEKSKPVFIPERHKEGLVSLEEINGSMCRFPIGDPQHKDFGFCGDRTVPSLPYCLDHAQVAYQPATRKRILKEEEKREEAMAMAVMKKAANAN